MIHVLPLWLFCGDRLHIVIERKGTNVLQSSLRTWGECQ